MFEDAPNERGCFDIHHWPDVMMKSAKGVVVALMAATAATQVIGFSPPSTPTAVAGWSVLKTTIRHRPRVRPFFAGLESTTENISENSNNQETEPLQGRKTISSSSGDQDDVALIQKIEELTEASVLGRGTEEGFDALLTLGELCQQRTPFEFEKSTIQSDADHEPNDQSQDKYNPMTSSSYQSVGNVVAKYPQLINNDVTKEVFTQVEHMVREGWLSTNADSVDSLPSFHLNLVSGGKPVAVPPGHEEDDDFQQALRSLSDLVVPSIYNELLPFVKTQLGGSSSNRRIRVDDIFIRRYGQDIIDGLSRNGISAHYDVFSRVTSVVALDNVASSGRNGLYTTVTEQRRRQEFINNDIAVSDSCVTTSNHAALRRFFPLASGDAVVHTWDVLHGVDVEPGLDRTSLIIWFTEEEEENEEEEEEDDENNRDKFPSPWLLEHPNLDTDNVAQFVLASAMESCGSDSLDVHNNTAYQELYLQSAARDNSFAMTRLGSIFDEGDASASLGSAAQVQMQQKLQSHRNGIPQLLVDDIEDNEKMLARLFWYEAALMGNPLAQTALADDLMATGAHRQDIRLLATVLFGLAAQQGHVEAQQALVRVIGFEMQSIENEEEFQSNAAVTTAQIATMHQPQLE